MMFAELTPNHKVQLSNIDFSSNPYLEVIPCEARMNDGREIDVYVVSDKSWLDYFGDLQDEDCIVSALDVLEFSPSSRRIDNLLSERIYELWRDHQQKMKTELFFFEVYFKDNSAQIYYFIEGSFVEFTKWPEGKIDSDIIRVNPYQPGDFELSRKFGKKFISVGKYYICLFKKVVCMTGSIYIDLVFRKMKAPREETVP